jgi:hypothetical protein
VTSFQCLIADKGNAYLRVTLCTKNPSITFVVPSRALSIYASIPEIAAPIFHDGIFMRVFVCNIKKAAFGWPIYTAWNLAAYTIQPREWTRRALRLPFALLFFVLSTAAWAAFWISVFWFPARLALTAADSLVMR